MSDVTHAASTSENNNAIGQTRAGETGSQGKLLAGIAIGAGLAYFLDPTNGAGRRAVMRDRIASFLRSTGRGVNAKAQHVTNRAQGVVAEARNMVGDEVVDDSQLAARVRAALGHHIDRVRPIEVVAEGGRVILRGQAPETEIETAVATARGVRGVAEVENQLQPAQAAQL